MVFTHNVAVWLDPDCLKKAFYWFASEQPEVNMTADEIMNTMELHGPFETQADADADAKVAIVGEDCVVRHVGSGVE